MIVWALMLFCGSFTSASDQSAPPLFTADMMNRGTNRIQKAKSTEELSAAPLTLGPCPATCAEPTGDDITHLWAASINTRDYPEGDGGQPGTQPLCVGAMPHFLLTKDRMGQVDMIGGGKIEYITVPKEADGQPVRVYKGMPPPKGGFLSEQDVKNTFVTKANWFSSKEVGETYVKNPQTANGVEPPVVVTFKLLRDIRLFDLGSKSNLEYLAKKLKGDEAWLNKMKGELPTDQNEAQQAAKELDRQISLNQDNQEILKMTTGFGVTLKEQIELLKKWGTTVTNDYKWSATEQIKKRGFDKDPMPQFDQVVDKKLIPVSHIETCSPLTNAVTGWGPEADQLHRVSYTTALDTRMTEIITDYTNTDGYYASHIPSLWHFGALEQEIALRFPASAVILETSGGAPQPAPAPAAGGGGDVKKPAEKKADSDPQEEHLALPVEKVSVESMVGTQKMKNSMRTVIIFSVCVLFLFGMRFVLSNQKKSDSVYLSLTTEDEI